MENCIRYGPNAGQRHIFGVTPPRYYGTLARGEAAESRAPGKHGREGLPFTVNSMSMGLSVASADQARQKGPADHDAEAPGSVAGRPAQVVDRPGGGNHPPADASNTRAAGAAMRTFREEPATFWSMVTKQSVVAQAAEISALEGFEAVTADRLAGEMEVTLGEVSTHFATDELLQQSIVWAGADVFRRAVTEPANAVPEGIERLRALLSHWVDYAESDAYRGGFVGGAADLPGHIRDLIAEIARSWIETLAGHVGLAVEQGHLPPATDPHQVAFEVHGLVQEANWTFGVLGDRNAYNRARTGIEHRIGR
ncbi:MAG: TetR/AcrR family transcriptional regulator [bacterium]|nr:TetR/AcrR family transcriptional regulator [bacterium]MDE0287603.1 TetR/AcrR family transcriptional regulator [bacterium]MDE0440223.1 TetR/AcrR family transcriptional regulator [bacterium]